jgi:hypothetical protein
MRGMDEDMFDFSGVSEQAYCFIDPKYSAVMTKVIDDFSAPVELNADEGPLPGVLPSFVSPCDVPQ